VAVTRVLGAVDTVTSVLSDSTYLGEVKQINSSELTASLHTREPDIGQPTTIIQKRDNSSSAIYLAPEVFNFLRPDDTDAFSTKVGIIFCMNTAAVLGIEN
jgi:hypothetical protein